jgi:uncharacterized protein YjbK
MKVSCLLALMVVLMFLWIQRYVIFNLKKPKIQPENGMFQQKNYYFEKKDFNLKILNENYRHLKLPKK